VPVHVTSPPATTRVTGVAAALLRTRWLVRAPVRLYRARLGFVLGSRFLMLEHAGRTSGLRRYVVLEVADHPSPGRYVVASGFGTRAQWFRNVQANPAVRVYLRGRKPVAATARQLPPDEAAAVLERYAARHPRAWRKARPVFEATLGGAIDRLPLVALDVQPVR
jgi:deazaflavin-dependent oxidoreductase (nitroreductase family)